MDRLGDYTGFTFNGVHSTTLGIYRVSESNRLSIIVVPTIKDISIDVPGTDFNMFFQSNYKEYNLNFQVAFKDITEAQFRRLKEFYGTKKPSSLIFDENPYKIYTAIGQGATNIKYISFENEGIRTYCGEAQLNFLVKVPYAISRFNFMDSFEKANMTEWQDIVNDATIMQKGYIETPTDTSQIYYDPDAEGEVIIENTYYELDNLSQWIEASEIREKSNYNVPYIENGKVKIKVYNSGDLPIPFSIRLKFINDYVPTCALWVDGLAEDKLSWATVERDISETKLMGAHDKYIKIDTSNNSVNGEDAAYNNTQRSYLQYFNGVFLSIPPGESTLIFSNTDILPNIDRVFYKFRYF